MTPTCIHVNTFVPNDQGVEVQPGAYVRLWLYTHCERAVSCNSAATVQAANISSKVFALKAPQSCEVVICIGRPAFSHPPFVCNIDKGCG